jgi:hypothetical protein
MDFYAIARAEALLLALDLSVSDDDLDACVGAWEFYMVLVNMAGVE